MKHINLSYINLQAIEYLIAIAKTGNITNASYQLNMSRCSAKNSLSWKTPLV